MNHGWHCPTFAVEVAQQSDLGMRRMNNQDSLAVVVNDESRWRGRGHLLMVADGMGAHAAGELASKLATDNIPHTYFKLRDLYPPAALRQAIREINALIYSRGQSNIGFQGMGTTCSCLVLLPQGALVAHVGDSRVYRLRGHRLAQLTFDHSLVWEMAAAGRMAEEDVPSYIPKNVITRSLGPHENVNIDLEGPFDTAAGDVFLLCSDGLSGQINDAEIGALLHCLAPQEAVQTLVDLANLRGGPDNISVIVARLGDGERTSNRPASKTTSIATKEASAKETVTDLEIPEREGMLLPIACVTALLVLAFCLVNSWWIASAVAGVALVASLGLLLAHRKRNCRCPDEVALGGPYGNGPYRDTSAEPNDKIVASLAELTDKLRAVPAGQGPKFDWRPLDDLISAGKAAAEHSDYCTAIRKYAEAIRAIMQQFRQHRLTTTDESGIHRA
jgi:serine/threonine protein phosphatase PrpC